MKNVSIPLYVSDFGWKVSYIVSPPKRIRLGVFLEELENGLKVLKVGKGSNAERMNLQKDDVLLALDGNELTDVEDLAAQLQKYNFGKLLEKYGRIALQGKLTGNLSLYFSKVNKRNNQGDVELSFSGVKTSNTVILTKELPDIVFEPGTIKMDFKNNGFSISEWEMIGDNLSVSMNGRW